MQPEFSFPHSYSLARLDFIPPRATLRYFPANRASGQDGLILHVQPKEADAWIGMFAFGDFSPSLITYVGSMPDARKLCVATRGAAYVVDAANPESWETVPAIPVVDVRVVPAAGLVVFATHTDLVAYGADGVKWRTQRLAWDGLHIVEVTDHAIVGEYWDLRSENNQRFEVDLATGASRGGMDA